MTKPNLSFKYCYRLKYKNKRLKPTTISSPKLPASSIYPTERLRLNIIHFPTIIFLVSSTTCALPPPTTTTHKLSLSAGLPLLNIPFAQLATLLEFSRSAPSADRCASQASTFWDEGNATIQLRFVGSFRVSSVLNLFSALADLEGWRSVLSEGITVLGAVFRPDGMNL